MSALLPLVAAALRDKAALDASKEIAALRKERDASRRVEIICMRDNGDEEEEDDNVVVYASGQCEDGRYGNKIPTSGRCTFGAVILPTIHAGSPI